ncbi:trypsin-3-like [Osmerus mordax]|uniref:trypsin-3-like n=1 Tax=Osmerus mordax TaxID=8014 RepID=UPI00350F8561
MKMALAPLLLLLLLCTDATLSNNMKRVVGGQPCLNTERLYHVQLLHSYNGETFLCGGSLISNNWVLTAAHCLIEGKLRILEAHVGVHPGPAAVQIITHYVIYFDNQNRQHDIMLLELPIPVDIVPIQLPDCATFWTNLMTCFSGPKTKKPCRGSTVQVAGHAATAPGANGLGNTGPFPPVLQCADFPVVACDVRTYNHIFCAGSLARNSGMDTCPGDSGGGVVYQNQIYGVIRSGPTLVCTGPTKAMDVCKYKSWIKTTTGL